jgi:hypothetical protein
MSVLITCPNCQKKLKVEEANLGRKIKCPACATVFAADTAAPVEDIAEAPRRAAKTAPRDIDEDEEEVRPRKRARDEGDEDEPRRPAAKRGREDDDEDDRPRKSAGKKSRRFDDDDDDDRRRRPAKSGGGAGMVLLILGGVGLLLCGGCAGVSYWLWLRGNEAVQGAMAEAEAQQREAKEKAAARGPIGVAPPNNAPGGMPKEEKRKEEKPKPRDEEKPFYVAEQTFADLMYDKEQETFATYVKQPLQMVGIARKVTLTPDGLVNEVFFEPQVEDLKTHEKKVFSINCRIPKPVPKANAPVGAMVTVRGRLTGASKGLATLNECVVVSAGAAPNLPEKPPEKPDKPANQPLEVTAQKFAQEMADNENEPFRRYNKQLLQLEGTVSRVASVRRMGISAVFFDLMVDDKKTGMKKTFTINCRIPQPVPTGDKNRPVVGKTVVIRGDLTEGTRDSATLNDCVVVRAESAPAPPEKPEKPGTELVKVKAVDLGKELYEEKQEAARRYFNRPLQVEGVVHQQTTGGDGGIAEIAFQLEVKDDKTGIMKPFLVVCKFSKPLPAGDKAAGLTAGKTVTVRGKLGEVSYIGKKATVNECVLVEPEKSP